MATNNPIDSLDPIQVALGGLGTSTLTANGVLYGNGTSAVGVTSVGTSTYLLTSNGPSSAPTFQVAPSPAAGSLVFISQLTASNSASLAFTSGITLTYTDYFFVLTNIVPATNTAYLIEELSKDGGSTWVGGSVDNGCSYFSYNSNTFTTNTSGTSGQFVMTGPLSNTSGLGVSGSLYNYNLTSGQGGNFNFAGNVCFNGSTSGLGTMGVCGGYIFNNSPKATPVDAIRFIMSSGNISSGTISLYGLVV